MLTAFLSLERDAIAPKGANENATGQNVAWEYAPKFRDKGEFCRGEPHLFFKIDLDGYEVEMGFEFPKPVYSKPTKTTCLLYRTLSYILCDNARQMLAEAVNAPLITSFDVSTYLRPD